MLYKIYNQAIRDSIGNIIESFPIFEPEIIYVKEISNSSSNIKDTLESFFRNYASRNIGYEKDTNFRTPLIIAEDNKYYQAESCLESHEPMGNSFNANIIVIENLNKVNEEFRKYLEYNNREVKRYNPLFENFISKTIYDPKRPSGNFSSFNYKVWNPEWIKRFFDDEKKIKDLFLLDYISLIKKTIIRENFIGYDPNTKEEFGIDSLLSRI